MESQQVSSPVTGSGASAGHRAVLLTGGAGVVGDALLTRLSNMNVVCLAHRAALTGHANVTSIYGDLREPRLGLSAADYGALAQRVDAVIHSAAITNFNRTDGSMEATNVEGTKHILRFAAAAGAPLYHVSTAYVYATANGERGRPALAYAASKRAGEDLVRSSGVPHVILRPSVVVGDSRTGEVRSFQGLYRAIAAILDSVVPLIPFDPSWLIDFVPVDVVADAIARVVEQELTSGELWITAGQRALRLDHAVKLCVGFGAEIGRVVGAPRFVAPEVFDRLIAPVFLDAIPVRTRNTIVRLLDFFAAYLSAGTAFPSSIDDLVRMGGRTLPDPRATLLTSLRYWAKVTGRTATQPANKVA
jgi:nucleoside-diphosphate-sugar epimerase